MAFSWSTRRQFLYYAVVLVLAAIFVFVVWQTFFTNPATCSDGLRNSKETGVDCGGSCALVCQDEARAPTVLWARAFETGPTTYTAAAYVENQNRGAGAKRVAYTFQIFDDKNLLVVEREGVIDLPPIQTVPIVETNIDVGNRTVVRTLFAFATVPVWNKIPASALPQLRLAEQNLAADGTRLSAMGVNDSLQDAENLVIVAVVFDTNGVARAASKTIVNKVGRKSSAPIIFTWPTGFEGVSRAEITILPSF
jgi:hypothetical protein